MRTMIFAVVVALALGMAAAQGSSSCPAIACPAIEYPPTCRVTYFSVKDGQVCQLCDDCINLTNHKDDNGCPLRACTMQFIRPECRERRYFVYNGRICEDCTRDVC